MISNRINHMTEGNEVKTLLSFAFPMFVGNIFQQFYNLVDSAIVGRFVGAGSLAAVGASGSLIWLFFALCAGLASGVGILAAQYFGAGQEEHVKETVANAFYLVGTAGIVMSILSMLFTRAILILLNTPPNILEEAVTYMRILCGGIAAVAIYNVVASILRALGDSKTPLFFLIFASIINVLLDLLFVCVFKWGSMGAAIATIFAQLLSATLGLLYAFLYNPFFKLQKADWEIQLPIIVQSAKIGVPVALQSAFIAISCVVLQGIVNSFGEYVIAAFTATSRIEQLVQQPFNSIEVAISTFTGQNIGAGKLERVKTGYHKSIVMIGIFALVMVLLMQLGSGWIMHLFVHEQKVIEIGATALCITSCFYFPLGMIYVTRGLLNGAGDAKYALMVGMVEVIVRVGCSALLVHIVAIGVWGIWYTTCATWVLTAIFSVLRYRQGKWRNISIVRA